MGTRLGFVRHAPLDEPMGPLLPFGPPGSELQVLCYAEPRLRRSGLAVPPASGLVDSLWRI